MSTGTGWRLPPLLLPAPATGRARQRGRGLPPAGDFAGTALRIGWVRSPAPLPWRRTDNRGLEKTSILLLIRNSGACEIALDRQSRSSTASREEDGGRRVTWQRRAGPVAGTVALVSYGVCFLPTALPVPGLALPGSRAARPLLTPTPGRVVLLGSGFGGSTAMLQPHTDAGAHQVTDGDV